jgi:hypothetical protein
MTKIQKKKNTRERETLLKRVATIDESASSSVSIIRSLLRLIKKITHNHSLHSLKFLDKKIKSTKILIKKFKPS